MPYETVENAIRDWDPDSSLHQWPEEKFRFLLKEVFRYQYRFNKPYRDFCEGHNADPSRISDRFDVPAIPTEVFKYVDLTVSDRRDRVFETSGTTSENSGRHIFETFSTYELSLHRAFEALCSPSGHPTIISLVEDRQLAARSSLSFMFSELVERWGGEESAFYVRESDGETTLDISAAQSGLENACASSGPVWIFGTAYGLVELLEASDRDVEMPPDSMIIETGGFKGKYEDVGRQQFYADLRDRLGISDVSIVSEYSMTELSSQAYTGNFFESRRNYESDEGLCRVFYTPPWARIDIVDAESLQPVDSVGERGLIRWTDLANIGSVVAVQTSDIGVEIEDGGIALMGRAEGSDRRGCSLRTEEIVSRETN